MTIFPPTSQKLKLGLGGAPLGNLFESLTDDAAHSVLQAALANGCHSFDTAPHYGNGLSEWRFGHALRSLPRSSYCLSTKVGRILRPDAVAPIAPHNFVNAPPFTQHWDFSAAGVRRSVEDSLQRMGVARLDTVFVHDCDVDTHGAAYPQVLHQVIQEAVPELQRMKKEGLLKHIGLGVNDVQVCLDVLAKVDLDCLLLAGRYTLIDHTGLPQLLPLCVQRGVRVAIGGAFNSGILATGVHGKDALRFNYESAPAHWVDRVAKVEAVCAAHGVPLRAAALQFPLAHPAVDIVLLGAGNLAQWQDSVAMAQHVIPAAFWQALQSAGLLPQDAPIPI
jgi:D-threo-aldose 1-dehydrogenase